MKKLLLFMFAIVAFAACEQAPIEEQSAIRPDVPDTITVGFEGDETRIQLNASQKTVWTKGDQVSVFYKSYDNLKFEFEGNTGDRNGTLKRVGGQHNGQTMDDVVVVYPYSADYMITLSEGCVNATIPSTQTYLKGSYGVGDNLMIARSSFNQFSLKSVCGWLKIQLTGDGEVIERITFRGNDGEQVAGLVYVDATTAEATLATAMNNSDDNSQLDGTLVLDDSTYTEVILDCGEGVALGKNATAFYIALPPQTFEKGFTVEIEDTEGYVMEQSTDKALLIERNHIQPMAALEFINPNRPTQPIPANNEIWYTATEKVEPYFDDFLTFGSNVDSNVWDSETKRGIITFDGDVTMIGDKAFYNCNKLNTITLPQGVTEIGEGAFSKCSSLTSVTIPDSVTEIGNEAFYYCSVTSVNIPDSVTTIGDSAFSSCYSLTSVTIGDGVTTIGNGAFRDCRSLTSVNIPDSVTTIGGGAFKYCRSLKEFTGKFAEDNGRILVVDGVLTAFAPAGITEYTIPNSVTSIGEGAFNGCDSLTSVNIPDSVTEIGYAAFAGCKSLTSVNIPDSVTEIGEEAFYECYSLTSVNIPNSVTTIGYKAFEYCKSLKNVYCYATIPPSLDSYSYAFSGNASGRRIYVYDECVELYKSVWSDYKDSIVSNGQNCPETTTIQYTTNDGNTITSSKLPIISNIYENGVGTLVVVGKISQIPNYAFEKCDSLTSVNIPDSVTSIGYYAFYRCSSLTSVNIPDSVTTIGICAFQSCDSLTSVNIPDSVTTIGNGAFGNCTSLKEFTGKFATEDGRSLIMDNTIIAYANASGTTYTILDSVTEIGSSAFYGCRSLKSVTIGDSVTTIGGGAFKYCRSLTSVYCKATTPPALGGTSVFDENGSGRKIYVPAGSVNAYKIATNWTEYASAIVGYDFENDVVVE